jgi:serine/threonine protein kinase
MMLWSTEAHPLWCTACRNIAACYGIGKYDEDDEANPGSLFIVQELVKGGNLLHKVYKQMLNRQKYVYTSQEALTWLLHVAEGMQYLHTITENKPMIIHRDLKLENIMLSPEGASCCKLVDFGLHKVIDDRIKKVVKRVVSEAQIGGPRTLAGRPVQRDEDLEEDDELEVALAEQRAKMAVGGGANTSSDPASSASAQATAAAAAAASPTSRFAPARRVGSLQMAAHAEEEEGEEEEPAVASPRGSPLARASPGEEPPTVRV